MEDHVEVLGEDLREDLLVAPHRLTLHFPAGFGELPDVYVLEKVQCLAPCEPSCLVGEQENAGDMVMNPADDRPTEPRREDVFLHSHKDSGLGPGFLGLRDMKVHLVAIKICVVGRAYGRIEPEGLVGHNLHPMGHYGHPVQRRLPIEEDDVTVCQLSIDSPAGVDLLGNLLAIFIRNLDPPLIGSGDVVNTGMSVGSPFDEGLDLLNRMPGV